MISFLDCTASVATDMEQGNSATVLGEWMDSVGDEGFMYIDNGRGADEIQRSLPKILCNGGIYA